MAPGLPVGLVQIVDKALAKEAEDRYQGVGEMLSDLESVEGSSGAAGAKVEAAKQRPRLSIAVLPFVNMSADTEQDYFCDGITEDIMNDLTRIKELHVAARTSSFAFKGRSMDAREIGKSLGVDVLLEGSVRKAGSRLRITTQLTNVADGYHLWSDRYDRETSDIFAIQDEIAHNIVRALEIKLSQGERKALAKAPTHDVVAYDFYLRGRKLFHQKRPAAIRQAIEMFTRAIVKDPNYALAHSGIADCYSYLSLFEDKESNLTESFRAVQKALELDPDMAEAHASRGLALSLAGHDHDEVNKHFEIAIKLNPALFEAYYFYGYSCRIQQRWQKAAQLFEQAAAICPEDYQAQNHLGMAYKALGLREKAEDAYRHCLLNIERHLELNPEDSRARQMGAVALIELGDLEKGLEWGSIAVTMDPENPMLLYNSACVFSVAGDTERAIECLEKAIRSGYVNKGALLNDPDLDLPF
jgi:TolB-like protein/Tfp pilus assembly protein PilF